MLSRSYDPSWGFDKLVRFDPSKFNTLLSQYKKKDGILNFFFSQTRFLSVSYIAFRPSNLIRSHHVNSHNV